MVLFHVLTLSNDFSVWMINLCFQDVEEVDTGYWQLWGIEHTQDQQLQ